MSSAAPSTMASTPSLRAFTLSAMAVFRTYHWRLANFRMLALRLYLIIVIHHIKCRRRISTAATAGPLQDDATGPEPEGGAGGASAREHHDHAVPDPGRHYQRRDLRAARAGAGAGLRGDARDPDSTGRIRHLWRADLRHAIGGTHAGNGEACGGDGRRRLRLRSVRGASRAACEA